MPLLSMATSAMDPNQGAMASSGWGGHTDQPKTGLDDRVQLGATARRAMTMGEDAFTLFRPSN
jgi:hypothetical protein